MADIYVDLLPRFREGDVVAIRPELIPGLVADGAIPSWAVGTLDTARITQRMDYSEFRGGFMYHLDVSFGGLLAAEGWLVPVGKPSRNALYHWRRKLYNKLFRPKHHRQFYVGATVMRDNRYGVVLASDSSDKTVKVHFDGESSTDWLTAGRLKLKKRVLESASDMDRLYAL